MNDLEHTVRDALRAIADDAGPLAGQATARGAIERFRRARRRRAGLLATAAATVVVAAGVPAALGAWTGSPERNESAVAIEAPTEPPPPTFQPSTPEPPVSQPEPAGTPVGGVLGADPADPELGVAHPFDLLTHCGIRWTTFGDREWRAVAPTVDQPGVLPGIGGGISVVDNYTSGTMTLLDEDLLRFTITEPYSAGLGESFDFVPMTDTDPRPLCD